MCALDCEGRLMVSAKHIWSVLGGFRAFPVRVERTRLPRSPRPCSRSRTGRISSGQGLHKQVRIRQRETMSDNPYADRRKLTFAQAEGVEALPSQLRLKEVSPELRARLWLVIQVSMRVDATGETRPGRLGRKWYSILLARWIFIQHQMVDLFDASYSSQLEMARQLINAGDYIQIFDFLQFVMRSADCPKIFAADLDGALSASKAAYRVLDNDTIVPITSEFELQSLQAAFAHLNQSEFQGARSHLKAASSELTSGNFAASVRESVHAVESVARVISPSGSLAGALERLENKAELHHALRLGFSKIYGFTSDEKGIRHPLLDEPVSRVGEEEAVFMIGACASFVSYMIAKARTAGLLSNSEKA